VSQRTPARFRWQLLTISLARLVINTGLRMVYPFAPALARGLGVELASFYNLVTLRNVAGFVSPLFDPLAKRFGHRSVISQAMLLFSASCLLVLVWPSLWPLAVALVFINLAKVIFDPAMQAYVGNRIPYNQRGKAFAVTELSWAGALLVGAPLVGLAIDSAGWQTPFLWLALLGIASTVLIWRVIPARQPYSGLSIRSLSTLQIVGQHPVIWAACVYSLLIMAANETFFIVYGDWMEGSFELRLASLGLASGIIGGAEIVGEVFAGWSVDHFGKRPVVISTGLLTALTYLIIPFVSQQLFSALLMLFMLFLFFETTVVGAIPLLSEIVPRSKGVVMAMVLAFGALGRALGDIIGPRIWDRVGLAGNGLAAAAIMTVAVILLARWIREGSDASD
jgi:predicted MFS family arabinose efflux permease